MFNKEGLTEEQIAEINAEIDRERTKASDTARKNAKKEFDTQVPDLISQAVEVERQKLEMSEQEKLEAERKANAEVLAQVKAEKKALVAQKKLLSAGFDDASIEAVLPLFTSLNDDVFEPSVDSFIETTTNITKTKVDAVKQELLAGATPPPNNSSDSVDMQSEIQAKVEAGQTAEAIHLLMQEAGKTN